jgi:GTP cyclohydrolase II
MEQGSAMNPVTAVTEQSRHDRDVRGAMKPVAEADLPSRFGAFRVVVFAGDPQGREHLALVRGDVRGQVDVPVRIHSECLTGDVLGSLRCDCRDQLVASLGAVGRMPYGVVLYLRQEGRGIGLTNKIRAYALQDRGHDTFEANRMLGFGEDERDYSVAVQMLHALGVTSVRVMTNNPAKVRALERGTRVTGRIPVVAPVNHHNAGYLETKRRRAGHWLEPVEARTGR